MFNLLLSPEADPATLFETASGPDALPQTFTKVLKPNSYEYGGEKVQKRFVDELGYSPEDLTAVQEISSAIEACSTFGMETTKLVQQFLQYEEVLNARTKSLKQYLQDLKVLDQIVVVGSSAARVVAITHAHPWLLHPFRVWKSGEKSVSLSSPEGGSKSSSEINPSESDTRNIPPSEQSDTHKKSIKSDFSSIVTKESVEEHSSESTTAQDVCVSRVCTVTANRKRTIEEIGTGNIDRERPCKRSCQGSDSSELRRDSSNRDNPDSTSDETRSKLSQHQFPSTSSPGANLVKYPDLQSEPVRPGYEQDGNRDESCEGLHSSLDVKGLRASSKMTAAKDGGQQGTQLVQEEDAQAESTAGDSVKENVKIEGILQSESDKEYEQISFFCHPWRIVDGSLNKPVCKGMIEAVLYHIMAKPGITEQKLISYYSAVLQPVIVMELLQGLEAVGCIQKRYLTKSKPVSLFSTPTVVSEMQEHKLSEPNTVFYEPTIDCVIKLSRVFPHESNWNKWIQ